MVIIKLCGGKGVDCLVRSDSLILGFFNYMFVIHTIIQSVDWILLIHSDQIKCTLFNMHDIVYMSKLRHNCYTKYSL